MCIIQIRASGFSSSLCFTVSSSSSFSSSSFPSSRRRLSNLSPARPDRPYMERFQTGQPCQARWTIIIIVYPLIRSFLHFWAFVDPANHPAESRKDSGKSGALTRSLGEYNLLKMCSNLSLTFAQGILKAPWVSPHVCRAVSLPCPAQKSSRHRGERKKGRQGAPALELLESPPSYLLRPRFFFLSNMLRIH